MESKNTTGDTPQAQPPQRKQLIIFFLFLAVTVGVALWMMIAEIWPADKLIELQAGWFDGEYYPKATFAVIWIMLVLAIVVVIGVAGWLWKWIKKLAGKSN